MESKFEAICYLPEIIILFPKRIQKGNKFAGLIRKFRRKQEATRR